MERYPPLLPGVWYSSFPIIAAYLEVRAGCIEVLSRPASRSLRVASRSHRGLPFNYSPNGFLFSKFFIFLRTSACHDKCVALNMLLLLKISSPRTARRDLGKIRSGSCKPKREERPPILKTFGLVSLQLDSSPITSRPGFCKVPSFTCMMQTKNSRQLCVMSGKIVTI